MTAFYESIKEILEFLYGEYERYLSQSKSRQDEILNHNEIILTKINSRMKLRDLYILFMLFDQILLATNEHHCVDTANNDKTANTINTAAATDTNNTTTTNTTTTTTINDSGMQTELSALKQKIKQLIFQREQHGEIITPSEEVLLVVTACNAPKVDTRILIDHLKCWVDPSHHKAFVNLAEETLPLTEPANWNSWVGDLFHDSVKRGLLLDQKNAQKIQAYIDFSECVYLCATYST